MKPLVRAKLRANLLDELLRFGALVWRSQPGCRQQQGLTPMLVDRKHGGPAPGGIEIPLAGKVEHRFGTRVFAIELDQCIRRPHDQGNAQRHIVCDGRAERIDQRFPYRGKVTDGLFVRALPRLIRDDD